MTALTVTRAVTVAGGDGWVVHLASQRRTHPQWRDPIETHSLDPGLRTL